MSDWAVIRQHKKFPLDVHVMMVMPDREEARKEANRLNKRSRAWNFFVKKTWYIPQRIIDMTNRKRTS